ncbi:MAG: putative collagen-binding domain-containing protein [Bryobacterales bacterium]
MQHLKKLILSRPYFERVPDQSLVAGENGERYDYVIATRGPDYAYLYTYTGREFSARLGVLPGKTLQASWYNPRNGASQPIGKIENAGERAFNPPGEPTPGNDWALVLETAQ